MLLAGAVGLLVVLSGFSAGLAGSLISQSSYHAIAVIPLPDAGVVPRLPPGLLSPQVVLRADGALVALGKGGYTRSAVTPPVASTIFSELASSSTWASTYPLSGRRSRERVELRLIGSNPRSITIDDPLQNALLPDGLFRLIAMLLHPLTPSTGADSIDPPIVLLHTLPSSAASAAAPLASAPSWLDPLKASESGGQRLSGSAISSARANWPPLGDLAYPGNNQEVRVAGSAVRLVWTAEWTDWMEEDR